MEIDLDSIDQPKTRWLDCGGVEFLIKYSSPREGERFRQRMISQGIARQATTGFEVTPGRDKDFCLAFAREYVLDWRGDGIKSANPEKRRYTPENMATVLMYHGGVSSLIQRAVADHESFFASNGGPQTTN